MTDKPTHTPLPWSYVRNPENTRYIIDDPQGRAIACTAGYEPDNEANAAFIVHAVNNHHDLIEALRVALDELWEDRHSHQTRNQFERYFASEIAALTKAEAGHE